MLVHPHTCLCILTAVQHAVVRLYAEATILHSMCSAAESGACFQSLRSGYDGCKGRWCTRDIRNLIFWMAFARECLSIGEGVAIRKCAWLVWLHSLCFTVWQS